MRNQVYKGELLSRTVVKNNILRIWEQTNQEERVDWYQEAYDWAERLSIENEMSIAKVCGVIASLSPVKRWEDNLVCAKDMINTGECGHMKLFKAKALAILNSKGTDVEILNILNGNKIKAFYINIRYPQRDVEVTIDRHALSIALGKWVNEDDYVGMTKKQYDFFVDCFTKASQKVGVSPLLMQSATWVKWRKIKTNYRQ